MPNKGDTIIFQKKELKGSRLRCLMLTSLPNQQVADFLGGLVHPYATVTTVDYWMPRGFLKPEEAKLGENPGFLSDTNGKVVTKWWLKDKSRSNRPNWDILSRCKIDGKDGLILVEAKAYAAELKKDDATNAKEPNLGSIKKALQEANQGLKAAFPGHWSLDHDKHYQLSNRFGLAWKVASLGVPVVLVYLGFLNAAEMNDGKRTILTSTDQWRDCLISYSKGVVPPEVWNRKLEIGYIPLITLIRTADVNVSVALEAQASST